MQNKFTKHDFFFFFNKEKINVHSPRLITAFNNDFSYTER